MFNSPFHYFSDPVLRAPTIASMLMCLSAALVGVIVVLRRQSLVGEMLSHAAYPGVFLAILISGSFLGIADEEHLLSLAIFLGAFLAAYAGLGAVSLLKEKMRIHEDSALCFVLSSFFGIGITLASRLQFSHTALYRQGEAYLFGQAATLTDWHIWLYSILVVLTILFIFFFFKELQVTIFNRDYAASLGLHVHFIDTLTFLLISFAVIIGLRSVGVVLMSAMLVAPAVAARQYTHSLGVMFVLAALFGAFSAFIGVYLSVEFTSQIASESLRGRFVLPTGPMIVLVASSICFFSLMFAPERGWVLRLMRIARFRSQCLRENLLKSFWRRGDKSQVTLSDLSHDQNLPHWRLWILVQELKQGGFITSTGKHAYRLTLDGRYQAAKIVRLHRLWEVYLADYVGVGADRVHRSAEEMEHILTPELEERLTLLLDDPKSDPHQQPIPPREVF